MGQKIQILLTANTNLFSNPSPILKFRRFYSIQCLFEKLKMTVAVYAIEKSIKIPPHLK